MKINNLKIFSIVCLSLFAFTSCDKDNLLEEEQYKKVIYLLSDGNDNLFNYSHALNDSISTGYITVGCGGTIASEKTIKVTLEIDTMPLYKYNRKNFDIEYDKYAKLLDPSRFVLPSKNTEIRIGDKHGLTHLPIEVNANGLSPDTTYIIPISIKTSDIEVNKEKSNVLYRVDLMNKYSDEGKRLYSMKGIKQEGNKREMTISKVKDLIPIDKNKVRFYPSNIPGYAPDSDRPENTELKFIEDNSILLLVKDDNTVKIKAYKNLDIEPLDTPSFYDPEKETFHLYYRYKLKTDDVWTRIEEHLERVDPYKN